MNSEELYEMCCRGSEEGWKEAARYVYRIISNKCWQLQHEDKEQLMNDTLLYFLNAGLEKVHNPKAFKNLLRTKAMHVVVDNHRKTKSHPPISDPPRENDHDDDSSVGGVHIHHSPPESERILFSKQALKICSSIIKSLKQECKEILPQYFRYKALGHGVGQLAQDMKKPLGSIASSVHRCLKKLYEHPQIILLKAEMYSQEI